MSSKLFNRLYLLLFVASFATLTVDSQLTNNPNKCILNDDQNGPKILSHENCSSILKARFRVHTTDDYLSFTVDKDTEWKANDGVSINYKFGTCDIVFQTHSKKDGQKWLQLTKINSQDVLSHHYKFLSQVKIDLNEDNIRIKGNENDPDMSSECKPFLLFETDQKKFTFEQKMLEGPSNLVLKFNNQNDVNSTSTLPESSTTTSLESSTTTLSESVTTTLPESSTTSTVLSSFIPATLAPREDFDAKKECIKTISSSGMWQINSSDECKRPFRAIFTRKSKDPFVCNRFNVSGEYDKVGNNSRIQYKLGNCIVNVTIQKVDGKVQFNLPDHKKSFDSNLIMNIVLNFLDISGTNLTSKVTIGGCTKGPFFRELVFEQRVIEGEPNTTFKLDCKDNDWDLTCASGFNISGHNACLPKPEENLYIFTPGVWEWSANDPWSNQGSGSWNNPWSKKEDDTWNLPPYKPSDQRDNTKKLPTSKPSDQKDDTTKWLTTSTQQANSGKSTKAVQEPRTTPTSSSDSDSLDDSEILNIVLSFVFLLVLLLSFIACGIAYCVRKDQKNNQAQYTSRNQFGNARQYYSTDQEYVYVNGQKTPLVHV